MNATKPGLGPPLVEGYYADNFATLLSTVVARYRPLLHPDELAFVETFEAMDLDARRLYVRLLARKGPLVRRDRLQYQEIGDLDGALDRLRGAGFVDGGLAQPAMCWLDPLLVSELRTVAVEFDVSFSKGTRKAALVEMLVAVADEQLVALQRVISTLVTLLAPRQRAYVRLFCLLFFGNLYQDWNAFVLRDLGLTRFEPYDLDPALRRFGCREAIDQTMALGGHRARLHQLLDAGLLAEAQAECEAVLARQWHPSVQRRVDRIAVLTGRSLERVGLLHEALGCYETAEATPPARERRARVLAQLGALDAAVRLCDEIASAPHDEVERVFAPRFADRLRWKRGERLPVRRRVRRPERSLVLAKPREVTIEQAVLDHLADQGAAGFFAQNWLWKSLFGLAFWDIVFAPVPGAFEQPFQLGPLDLNSSDFRRARADLIKARLTSLRETISARDSLLATFDQKEGTANALVSWHSGARDHVGLALECLTGAHLAWVFDRLSREIGRYRRGFPDLFVISEGTPGFALYEVKGPGDQLRPEQRGWLDYLNEGGLPALVMPVIYGE